MGPDSGCMLVLDDEDGLLKSVPDLMAEGGKGNVIYASNIEEARSGLGAEMPKIALLNCSAGPAEAEAKLADLGMTPEWIIAGATKEQASDPEFLRLAMQARFNDIVTMPLDTNTLMGALENGSQHIKGSPGGRGKVVVLYSGKGGVGVSSLAVNLALALNRMGGLRVGIIDIDLQCGSVASLLNLQPTQTLGKLGEVPIQDANALREEVHSRITPHDSGLRVVAAPNVLHDGLNVTADMLGGAIRILRDRFDILLVDTPKWVGDRLVAAMDEADKILLVIEPQIPALAKARESLRLFSRFEYPPEKVSLVFNRVDKKGELQPEEASEALNRPVFHSIPLEAARLLEASNKGNPPLADPKPKGPFAAAVMELAGKLRTDLGFAPIAPAKKKRGLFFGRRG